MLKRLANVYPVLFRTDLAVQFQYRAAMVIWLIGLVIQPVIYLVVWLAVAEARDGQVGGFTGADFAKLSDFLFCHFFSLLYRIS